jgi:hypothetical protein
MDFSDRGESTTGEDEVAESPLRWGWEVQMGIALVGGEPDLMGLGQNDEDPVRGGRDRATAVAADC